jgi:hypothetical protein
MALETEPGPDMRGMALGVWCLLAACAGVPQTDWQTRIGHSSLDDVKRELGPPESCSGLDDGGTACSWTTSKSKDRIDKLVLTFGSNGQLATATHVRL